MSAIRSPWQPVHSKPLYSTLFATRAASSTNKKNTYIDEVLSESVINMLLDGGVSLNVNEIELNDSIKKHFLDKNVVESQSAERCLH